jgi:hypothetical protein
MQRPRRYQIVSIVLCLVLGGLGVVTACSNYGEGERCDVNNNNDDCQNPLQCTPKAQINAPFNSSDRCCPVDRATATHPACTQLQATIDAAAPPETGPGTDATVDAPVETSTVEAGTDADAADSSEGG